MDVKAGAFEPFLPLMPEIDAKIILVRGFILAEANVSVNACDRSAIRARVEGDVGDDGLEARFQHLHKTLRWGDEQLLIVRLMCLEPLAVIVTGEFAEELQPPFWEAGELWLCAHGY